MLGYCANCREPFTSAGCACNRLQIQTPTANPLFDKLYEEQVNSKIKWQEHSLLDAKQAERKELFKQVAIAGLSTADTFDNDNVDEYIAEVQVFTEAIIQAADKFARGEK
jgi:hypothetical protein